MDFCFWVTAVVYLFRIVVLSKDKYTIGGATVVTQDQKSENFPPVRLNFHEESEQGYKNLV